MGGYAKCWQTLVSWEDASGCLVALVFKMGAISKHNQEDQLQTMPDSLHSPSLGNAFRICNPKEIGGLMEILNSSDHTGGE